MIQSPDALKNVRRGIRRYQILREEDPVDLVMLASVAANFATDREVPIWLVIVGDPASGKTDLISLVQDWWPVWTLPDVLTEAYFFSAKTGEQSALDRIQVRRADGRGYRIMYAQDMGALMSMNRLYAPSLYAQFRSVHDGLLVKETGLTSKTQIYGVVETVQGEREPRVTPIPPAERLGWLGAATPEFYGWQARHNALGARFMSYLHQPFADWDDFKSLTRIDQARAEKAHWAGVTKQMVHQFLDMVLANLEGYEGFRLTESQSDQIAAAVRLANRVTGTRNVTDTGARLHPRVTALCRMMAFMAAKPAVSDEEITIGLRIVMSQIPADELQILTYALSAGAEFRLPQMLPAIGMTRRQVERPLEGMVDVGILTATGQRGAIGFTYGVSPKTRRLAMVAGLRCDNVTPFKRKEGKRR